MNIWQQPGTHMNWGLLLARVVVRGKQKKYYSRKKTLQSGLRFDSKLNRSSLSHQAQTASTCFHLLLEIIAIVTIFLLI